MGEIVQGRGGEGREEEARWTGRRGELRPVDAPPCISSDHLRDAFGHIWASVIRGHRCTVWEILSGEKEASPSAFRQGLISWELNLTADKVKILWSQWVEIEYYEVINNRYMRW
ncbi:uncharacterized protein LOC122007252 isoform X2 [Zingiber officinale]|uniref:uncharacterized protein LOC122007252 isoform X2 n=1 Tax=Zingiber officinale TaxID=94328 RepID=UPI001C4C639F|nr:uncharacterized protein LOC122007252 isoform X2 [Zingiber officinale]